MAGVKINEATQVATVVGTDVIPVARPNSEDALATTAAKLKDYATAEVSTQLTQLSQKVGELVTLEFVESNYVNRARCNTENGTWLKNDGYFGAFFKLNAGVENIKVTTSSQGVIYAFLKDDSFNNNVTDILPHFCNGVTNFVRDEEHKGVTITIDNIPTDCGCIYFYLGKSSSSYNWKPSSVVVNYSKIGGVEKELSNVKSSIGILESSTKAARLENMRGIIDVAYSKGAVGAIGNTIGHFSLMVSRGFKYIKADARITSDNGIILCHDLGYTLDDDGKIVNFSSSNYTPISSMTTSQCKALTFASDNTSHPCELSELLKYAKRKMLVVYLSIRTADSVSIIDSLVKRYSMSGDVIYNIYPKENWNYEGICAALYEKDKNSLICWTAKRGETITLSMLQDAVNSHCSYFCTWGNNSNDATAYRQEEDLTEEMWSYAASHGLHIMSLTQNSAATELSLSRGIIGFQNYILTPIE